MPTTAAASALPATRPFEAGFDDSPQALAKLDLLGRFREINPRFARLVGYPEQDFRRARWPSPHDRPRFAEQKSDFVALVSGRTETLPFDSRFMHGGSGLLFPLRGLLVAARFDGRVAYVLMVADRS